MKISLIIQSIILISACALNNIYGQSIQQIIHTSGTININDIQVTASSSDGADTTTFCVDAQPYRIGHNNESSESDLYTFQFLPPIDSLTLNFGGIHGGMDKEIVKINVNGNHYTIPSINNLNSCSDSLALLTISGDITGSPNNSRSGCNGITIYGPIHEIIIKDSVATGHPNGAVFSLFIYTEIALSLSENKLSDILVFPVPAKDKIIIKNLTDKDIKMRLIDTVGRSQHFDYTSKDNDEVIIDVSKLFLGVYFLIFETNGAIETRKVVIE